MPSDLVWTCDTLNDNYKVRNKFAKYLMESYRLSSEEHLSFKYFLKIAFVRESLQNCLAVLAAKSMDGQFKPVAPKMVSLFSTIITSFIKIF